jgi:hypothetical protein
MANFPRAGSIEPKADDPMMKRVDMDHAEIGSRPSGMPKDMKDSQLSIAHVGGSGKGGS